jgi:hypothetical protein
MLLRNQQGENMLQTYGGHVHDKPSADATPYPLRARSQLLQERASWRLRCPRWS